MWRVGPGGNYSKISNSSNGRPQASGQANYNVQRGGFDLTEIQEMDFSEREMEKFKLKKGDLLVCEGGEVGRCAVWEKKITPCFYQKALHRLRPRIEGMDVFFTMYYVHLTSTLPRMVNHTSQTSISHFTREQFLKFPIAVPPFSEQRRIAQVLSAADNEINQLEAKLKALEKQKRGLMQKLLTGEVRVK